MIKFSNLVSALQEAAQGATAAVAQEQIRILNQFFHGDIENPAPSSDEPLKPVMVRMAFPNETAEGAIQHDVYVPLISLVPASGLQIKKMELEVDFQALEENGELVVGSPPSDPEPINEDSPNTTSRQNNLKLRIEFSAAGVPEGAQVILDGYSRALRAQIPN